MSDYDRIRVLWPDHLGLARGKYLPIHLAEYGTGHCVSVFALGYDRSMIPAPGAYLLEGLPDVVATFDPDEVRRSWEDDATGVVVGHLDFRGRPYTVSARFALQRAIAAWGDLGYSPKVGIEFEAYVLQPDGKGGWERWQTPRSFVYGTGRSADPTGLIDDITRTAWRCGFPLESINAEYDESQFELTLEYDDALKAADEAFLFRVLAREVALGHGLDLTFLGKPFVGVAGSGVHVNFSLVDAAGQNTFNDTSADDGLSALTKGCLAGLVTHHQALTALCAPTVNAYRRLQPGELNGYWANWGHDHRGAANRMPEARGAATRIENRVSDGAVNIHLGVATILQAAQLGVVDELDCPEPLTTDGVEETNTDVCAAPSLAVALEHLMADPALMAAVGDDLCQNFIANKQAEWERYIAAVGEDVPGGEVTQWELDEYLMYH
ncbi:glutamine synthetase family protein [Candidatus Poriferisocius sp.]|uniref:glutamine synthetase family protein n=1 Tax=Candidatus Poriferisocius sp. TaxID=3101276 RepID=UPI003B01BA35